MSTERTTFTVTIPPLTTDDCAILKKQIMAIEILMMNRMTDENTAAEQAIMTTLDPLKDIAEKGCYDPMPSPKTE